MASITIRQLPETTKRKLRIRAAEHGRSMEQEAREILQAELAKTTEPPKDIVKAIREICLESQLPEATGQTRHVYLEHLRLLSVPDRLLAGTLLGQPV